MVLVVGDSLQKHVWAVPYLLDWKYYCWWQERQPTNRKFFCLYKLFCLTHTSWKNGHESDDDDKDDLSKLHSIYFCTKFSLQKVKLVPMIGGLTDSKMPIICWSRKEKQLNMNEVGNQNKTKKSLRDLIRKQSYVN